MIVVAGSVLVNPTKLENAIQLAIWMQQETAKESGCIEYRFSQDLEQANLFHVFERWETETHLKNHFSTPHMAQFNQQLAGLLLEKPKVYKYETSSGTSI